MWPVLSMDVSSLIPSPSWNSTMPAMYISCSVLR